MKKRIILIVLLLFVITGCNSNQFDIGEKSKIIVTKKDVILKVKEGSLKPTEATFILKNNSDVDIQYGVPYELEIKKDGVWHSINVEISFILPAYILKAKEEREIKLNWENSYGVLAKGEYRMIKDYSVENDNGYYDSFFVAVEFEIK